MFGGLSKAGWATILVTGGLVLGTSVSAQAADLGGDCCADLEERVAELEATTARKGNRKVSLTISGWVNEAVVLLGRRHRVERLRRHQLAGAVALQVRGRGQDRQGLVSRLHDRDRRASANSSSAFNSGQTTTAGANTLHLRKSNWWLKSKTYGKMTVGLDGSSTYHLLDDADGANTRNYSDAEAAGVAMGGFLTRSNGVLGPSWGTVMRGFNNKTPGQDGRRNIVRYDTPEFGGFTASASWGEDDLWDTALTYKGEFHDFKIDRQDRLRREHRSGGDVLRRPCRRLQVLLVGRCRHRDACTDRSLPLCRLRRAEDRIAASLVPTTTSTTWFLQPGIEKKWHPIGKTTIFGEYRKDDPGASVTAAGVSTTRRRRLDVLCRRCRAEHRSGFDGSLRHLPPCRRRLHEHGRWQREHRRASTCSSPAPASSSERPRHLDTKRRESRPSPGGSFFCGESRVCPGQNGGKSRSGWMALVVCGLSATWRKDHTCWDNRLPGLNWAKTSLS